jgi:transcription antitermination factor NusG
MQVSENPQWFAVYTFPRHEKKVATFLAELNIQSFCPVYSTIHFWKKRKAHVQLPLFPGYVFVNVFKNQRVSVLSAPGVVQLVGPKGNPSPLPADQLEALRNSLSVRKAKPHPFLYPGRTVRVGSGPLQGLEGLILRRKGQMRMVVSLSTINQSIMLELEESDLIPVGVRAAA